MDLRGQILAKLDRREALARRAYDAEPGPWALHHNKTRFGRADEWEIRDYDGDSLAWVGTENDARLIVATGSPDVVLRQVAAARRVLDRHAPSDAENVWERGESHPACTHGYDDPDDMTEALQWRHCPEVLDLADSLGIEVTR